jgi:hypothetical protein
MCFLRMWEVNIFFIKAIKKNVSINKKAYKKYILLKQHVLLTYQETHVNKEQISSN